MDAVTTSPPVTRTALEDFLRDYVETVGGAWDEVEPQVYDLLLPAETAGGVVRVTFDPEALPEHPGAQLASQLKQERRNMQVLLMSGYPDDATAHEHPLNVDAAYLQKPFTAEGLAQKVREVLGRAGSASPRS